MTTKKFMIEVEEGVTNCAKCPFTKSETWSEIRWFIDYIDCNKYNLATMKIKEIEEGK